MKKRLFKSALFALALGAMMFNHAQATVLSYNISTDNGFAAIFPLIIRRLEPRSAQETGGQRLTMEAVSLSHQDRPITFMYMGMMRLE